MLKENTCRFIVFDFDDHNGESDTPDDWQKEVDTMRDICLMCGIDCLVERSRSGHGAPSASNAGCSPGRRIG